MASMKIVSYPDPVLRTPAQEVEEIDDRLVQLVQDMIETMYANRGVGLAAPQVGVGEKLIVVNLTGEAADGLVLVNPRIVSHSGGVLEEEGCLSVPGITAKVRRPQRVTVEGYTLQGEAVKIEAEDLYARVLQHELDHLNGTLFVDKLAPASRLVYEKLLQEMEAEYSSRRKT